MLWIFTGITTALYAFNMAGWVLLRDLTLRRIKALIYLFFYRIFRSGVSPSAD